MFISCNFVSEGEGGIMKGLVINRLNQIFYKNVVLISFSKSRIMLGLHNVTNKCQKVKTYNKILECITKDDF